VKTFVMERLLLGAAVCGRNKKEEPSMKKQMTNKSHGNGYAYGNGRTYANGYTNGNGSANGNANGQATTGVDWSQLTAQAMFEGGQAFLKTISSAAPDLDEAQLQADEDHADLRFLNAINAAQQNRANPGPHLLSAIRNWSKKQAFAILREKIAGKPIRQDFYQPFQYDLQEEIASLISDLHLFWDQEDEQREAAEQQHSAAKREEAERAFGAAYPYIQGLGDAVLSGERQRQVIFNDGVQAAQGWAAKYGDSVKERERLMEEREKRVREREAQDYEHQRAMRALMIGDQRTSFADTVVRTSKNTLGCLLMCLLLFAGILLAIYFAFPHH
jgi:hypothetical protein